MKTGPVESFKEFSNFKSLKEFNNNIEMFLAMHKKEFTRTEYMLFRRLTKYCAKVAGVANASIKAILNGTKEKDFKLGASESTFHRMKRKAIKLGILEVKQTERGNGSQSSNVWIFKRFVSNSDTIDTPKTEGEQSEPAPAKEKVISQLTSLKTDINYKTNKHITKRIDTLDHTYTSDYVPKEFRDVVKYFYDDAELIQEYWRMAKIESYDYKKWIDDKEILDIAIHSFKQLISKLKKVKIHNPIAYFTGVLKRQINFVFLDIMDKERMAN